MQDVKMQERKMWYQHAGGENAGKVCIESEKTIFSYYISMYSVMVYGLT